MYRNKTDFQGFKVLCIQFSATSTSQHEMFMKEHSVRNQTDDKPIGRTLFIINVPPWATEESIQNAFSVITPVESVKFDVLNKASSEQNEITGFKTAYVVFKSPADLYKALKIKNLPPLSSADTPIITGVTKWIKQYNLSVTSQKQREEEAIEIIKNYVTEEARKLKEKKGNTDDEGWTTVTKKGRNPGISRKESVNNKLAEKVMKKDKILKNFYRHQIRQEKRDQLATLRKKAEEDKKKILVLKQRRAFNPF